MHPSIMIVISHLGRSVALKITMRFSNSKTPHTNLVGEQLLLSVGHLRLPSLRVP